MQDLAELFLARGFGSSPPAARFCNAHDELRDYYRPRQRQGTLIPLR